MAVYNNLSTWLNPNTDSENNDGDDLHPTIEGMLQQSGIPLKSRNNAPSCDLFTWLNPNTDSENSDGDDYYLTIEKMLKREGIRLQPRQRKSKGNSSRHDEGSKDFIPLKYQDSQGNGRAKQTLIHKRNVPSPDHSLQTTSEHPQLTNVLPSQKEGISQTNRGSCLSNKVLKITAFATKTIIVLGVALVASYFLYPN